MPTAPAPRSVGDALAQLDAALEYLTEADWVSMPTGVQRAALVRLARAEARQVSARTCALYAFDVGNGYRLDGHCARVPWLTAVTRVTKGAAREQAGWMRTFTSHPRIAAALSGGLISPSWGRQFATWNNRLDPEDRDDADEILVDAAVAGLPLEDIAKLAQEIYERSRTLPDDEDGPFRDRQLRLERTFGGAGKLIGDLSPECAEIVQKIFDAFGKRAGSEDLRSEGERNHDALAEAGRRLLKANMIPQSSGMDTKAMVYIPLSQLRQLPGASGLEAAWIAARAGEPGWLTGPGAQAVACSSEVTPVVTGTVDWQALDQMTDVWLEAAGMTGHQRDACGCTCGRCACHDRQPLKPETKARLSKTLLHLAIDTLSGPGGLAGYLRARALGAPFNTSSIPLDIGCSRDVPEPIRRAVINRDRHCAWPGCDKPPAACEPHHLTPLADGGHTSIRNLKLFCWYHHHVCIHRDGWTVTVHADGSVEARAPWGQVLHSHGPPAGKAA